MVINWPDLVELFVSFTIDCAEMGCLKLNQEQLIGLYNECLVWILFLGDKSSEPRVYFSLGQLHRKRNQLKEAMENYNMFLKATEDAKEVQTLVHMILGNIHSSTGEYQKAIDHFTTGQNIAVEFGDKENERFAVHNLGGVYFNMKEYDMAKQYYEQSLGIAKQQRNKTWEMEAYENLGAVCLYGLNNFTAAIEYGEQCLSIASVRNDARDITQRAYRNLAIAYQETKEYEQSLAYSKHHLNIALKSSDKKGQKQDYVRMGLIFDTMGRYHEAIVFYTNFLDISAELKDIEGEADACKALATAYRSVCKYNQAMWYHKKTIAIAKQLQNKGGEAIALGSMANTYLSLGQYKNAIECAQDSLDLAREIGERRVESNALGQLGNVYHKLHDFQRAIKYHKESLDISIKIGDKVAQMKTYGNIGLGYVSLGDNDKAIEHHRKNLDMAIESGDKPAQVNPYGHLGHIYRLMGEYEKSIEATKNSLALAEELDDKEGQAGAYYLLAVCRYMQSRKKEKDRPALLEESEKILEESIRCYEWMFENLEDQDQFKISIVDTFVFAYKLLTRVYIETGQNQQALLTSERGRARALSDLLITKYNMEVNLSSQTVRMLQYSDVESIVTTSCNFCILFYGIVMKTHKTVDNYVVEGCVATWVVTADQPLVTTINDEIEDLVESWIVAADQPLLSKHIDEIEEPIESSTLNPADESVTKLVSQAFDELNVRQAVGCEDRSLDASDNTSRCVEIVEYDDSPLEELFELFISPIQDHLTKDEIIIIPDGPLFTVPYAALRDPKTKKYLSESKRIRLAPSLATLKILKESSAGIHTTAGALIVGNPVVGKVEFQGKVKHFQDLPGAKREAEVIGKMLGVSPITGKQATKQAIKERLQQGVDLIHFAAHGSTEGEIALTPNLTPLAQDNLPQEADYLLTMQDVQDIGITAQLVVLSCCHSGRGEIKSEGVVGMSRAFLAAGARAVVGSLWAVADEATMVFMEGFYTHLKRGESASTGLHETMKDMRKKYREPMFWAPFFLIGDDVTIHL